MEFQVFAPQSMVTARNRDRSVFSAWGLAGGHAGATSRFAQNPDTPGCIELGSTDVVHCNPGDVILIRGPGGGGYGDPLDRPEEDVAADVRRGFISAEHARSEYGVVLGDPAATARLRGDLSRQRVGGEFGHGPGRVAHEAVWSARRYETLTELLLAVPVTWRYFVKHRLFAALKGRVAPVDGGADDVVQAYATLVAQFPDLPPPPAGMLREAAHAAE
jgi:N-methylhydantoinase B